MDRLDFGNLDPGIRETVRFLRENGFWTTDSGDGSSKPEEERVMDFPHVVIRCHPSKLLDNAWFLRDLLRTKGIEVGPQDGVSPAIEASYDVGARVATILLSGVTDSKLLNASVSL